MDGNSGVIGREVTSRIGVKFGRVEVDWYELGFGNGLDRNESSNRKRISLLNQYTPIFYCRSRRLRTALILLYFRIFPFSRGKIEKHTWFQGQKVLDCLSIKSERSPERGDEWVFGPEAPYEQHGDVDKVALPCGCILAPDGDTLRLYYGAADTSIAVATGRVQAMLGWLRAQG